MGRDSLLNDHHIYAPTHPIITLIMVLHPNSSYIYIYVIETLKDTHTNWWFLVVLTFFLKWKIIQPCWNHQPVVDLPIKKWWIFPYKSPFSHGFPIKNGDFPYKSPFSHGFPIKNDDFPYKSAPKQLPCSTHPPISLGPTGLGLDGIDGVGLEGLMSSSAFLTVACCSSPFGLIYG